MMAWMSPLRTVRLTPQSARTPPKDRSISSTTTRSPLAANSARRVVGYCAERPKIEGSRGAAHVSTAATSDRSESISTPRGDGQFDGVSDQTSLRFQFAHQRNHAPAEGLDLFVEMQEAEQYEIDANLLQRHDPLGDLLRRADEVGAEAVVVLNENLRRSISPSCLRPPARLCQRS